MISAITFWTLLVTSSLIMTGCTGEKVYESIYQGVKMEKQSKQEPGDGERIPDYGEYQQERQKVVTDK